MKILWIVNAIIPRIQKMQSKQISSIYGGWLSGMSDHLLRGEDVELCICYPQYETKEEMNGEEDNFSYCGLPMTDKIYKEI